jgi:hypothetical protein
MKKCTLRNGSWMVKITDNGLETVYVWSMIPKKEYILISTNQCVSVSSDDLRLGISPNSTIIKDPTTGEIAFTRLEFIDIVERKPLVWEGEVQVATYENIFGNRVIIYDKNGSNAMIRKFVNKRTKIRIEEIVEG